MDDEFDLEAFLAAILRDDGTPDYAHFLAALKNDTGVIDLDLLYCTLSLIPSQPFQFEINKHRQESAIYHRQGDELKNRVKNEYIRVKTENTFNELILTQNRPELEKKYDVKALQPHLENASEILGKRVNNGRTMMEARSRTAHWPVVVRNQSVLLQVCLPRNDQGDYQTWDVKNGESTVQLQAGSKPDSNNRLISGKLPWGKLPRLILFYINVLVNRHGNQVVKLGNSVSQFLLEVGLSRQGYNYDAFYTQLDNLMRCSLINGYQYNDIGWPDAQMYTFSREGSRTTYQLVSDQIDAFSDKVQNKEILVKLSDTFYQSMLDNPLQISMQSIKALGKNLLAMDIFALLAERLPHIDEDIPEEIDRSYLEELFGSSYEDKGKFFRESFKPALALVKEHAYQEANVELEKGKLILLRSAPASLGFKDTLLR